jgi:putative FmdB family regulatory protein
MPLYEYECESCGHRREVIQKFSDPPLTVCDTCGGPLRKLLSSPAIQFKGSGWYITDYARAGKSEKVDGTGAKEGAAKGEGASESNAKGASAAKGDAKTETKTTETKTESKPSAPSTSS